MEKKEKIDVILHFVMCFTGGFIGAYSVLNRMDVLASAQTTNMMEIVICLLGHNIFEFITRFVALFIYMLAIALTVVLGHKTNLNLKRYAIVTNIVGLLILSLLPADMNPIIALYPLFFITATQWSIFHGAKGYNCSTIFSTNNLKQFVLSFTNYYIKREPADLEKGKFYIKSLCCFYVGVGISYFAFIYFGIIASLFGIIPMLFAFYFSSKEVKIIEKAPSTFKKTLEA